MANQYQVDSIILMDIHLSQLVHCCEILKSYHKKIIIHLDLIKGLTSDAYAVDYLIHDLGVDGIISVKSSIVQKVKTCHKIAIQRLFLIDTQSYQKSIALIKRTKPDYIELLPGCLYKMIKRVKEKLNIEVLAGGLIETREEYEEALISGARAITTSSENLLKIIKKN